MNTFILVVLIIFVSMLVSQFMCALSRNNWRAMIIHGSEIVMFALICKVLL